MWILYVFPEPLPLPRARGVQVAQFIRALATLGCHVTLAYVPDRGGHPFVPIGADVPENVTLLPISRHCPGLPCKSHRFFIWRLGRWLRHCMAAGSAPDVVFFRHIKAAASFAEDFPWLPMVYEAHEVFAQTAKPSQRLRLQRLEGKVLAHAGLVLSNSRGSATGLQALYTLQKNILVLPNGVAFPAEIAPKNWDSARRQIIYAGSLFGWKGVDDLVAAAAHLPDYRISVLGGSAEQIERLRQQQSAGGAEIEFTGQIPQHAVQKRLESACVAVLPNRPDQDSQYTSPLKLFEYMAAGCAVVATDLPAVREILGEQDAFWAQPADPVSLAEAIVRACADPGILQKTAMRGRELVRERTWERRGELLLAALKTAGMASFEERTEEA